MFIFHFLLKHFLLLAFMTHSPHFSSTLLTVPFLVFLVGTTTSDLPLNGRLFPYLSSVIQLHRLPRNNKSTSIVLNTMYNLWFLILHLQLGLLSWDTFLYSSTYMILSLKCLISNSSLKYLRQDFWFIFSSPSPSFLISPSSFDQEPKGHLWFISFFQSPGQNPQKGPLDLPSN